MSDTKTNIAKLFESYLIDEAKFEKGNTTAGTRARAYLLEIKKLGLQRRKEISAVINERRAK